MTQQRLDLGALQPVLPRRSPLRYPGGKTRLTREIVARLGPMDAYAEPFVGGGSVLLTVAATWPGLSDLWANDLDEGVADFWRVIVGPLEDLDELLAAAARAPVDVDFYRTVQETVPDDRVGRAFRTLYLSKTSFSGMATQGPIGGWEQTGDWLIGCQYDPENIARACRQARTLLEGRLMVTCLDFRDLRALEAHTLYVDPPYYAQQAGTYPHMLEHEDHLALAGWLTSRDRWVLSYRDHPEIRRLYAGCAIERIDHRHAMSSAHRLGETWRDGEELLIAPRT